MSGLAIESATDRLEVAVLDDAGRALAHVIEVVGHGHARHLTGVVGRTLERAGIGARDLKWIAADLGPGSFTGVRVGLASAIGLAMTAGAEVRGASSLAALAHGAGARRALVVPLVPAGRRESYAGFFRTDARGDVRLLAAPTVGDAQRIIALAREAQSALGVPPVRFVGPGVPRDRAALEEAFPKSTSPEWRGEGLSALDLARAALKPGDPGAGLPASGAPLTPLYVRPAQAEERVRHRAHAAFPTTVRDMTPEDLPAVLEVERAVFSDPWPESGFLNEMIHPFAWSRIAEREGQFAGYAVAWLGEGEGHLGNLATVPGLRRRGVAAVLLDDLLVRARALGVRRLTLEVRVSNFPAQWLYRARGFRLAGLRRRYYRDNAEDALVLEWRPGADG